MFLTLKISTSRSYVVKVLPGFLGEWMSLALKALQNRETRGFGGRSILLKMIVGAQKGPVNRNYENHLVILLMEEILHQFIGSLSHYLQGFLHPRWCRISSVGTTSYISRSQKFITISLDPHQFGGLVALNNIFAQHSSATQSEDLVTFTSLLGFQNDSTAWIRALALLPQIYQAQLEPDAHLWNAIIGDVSASGHWRLSFLTLAIKSQQRSPVGGGVGWDGSSISSPGCHVYVSMNKWQVLTWWKIRNR